MYLNMKNKDNISTIFLLPGTEIKEETKKKFRTNGFINTYLTCDQLSYPFKVIYLLFQPKEFGMEFYSFMKEMQANQNFIEVVDLGKNKTLLVYRIPKRFTNDYDLFLEGKYSQLSKEYKRCFAMEDYKRDKNGNPVRENGKYVKEPSRFYHILNRTEELRDRWKLVLYGDGEDPDTIDHTNAYIVDDMELYEKQDPGKETLGLGIELW